MMCLCHPASEVKAADLKSFFSSLATTKNTHPHHVEYIHHTQATVLDEFRSCTERSGAPFNLRSLWMGGGRGSLCIDTGLAVISAIHPLDTDPLEE